MLTTELPGLKLLARGKVRDVYDLGGSLLLVATDRLSAFDHVLPNPIPDKGRVLNQISAFWFERTRDTIANHVIATRVTDFPAELRTHAAVLAGRSTLAKKLKMFPVECVARGYLAGSGWKEYRERGTVCGIPLPQGLRESDRLPEPIFTPATKAETGHDENISFDQVVALVGGAHAEALRDRTLALYRRGQRPRRHPRHPDRRHQVRVRPGCGRLAHPGRRGADAGLLAVLAGRGLHAGPRAAVL